MILDLFGMTERPGLYVAQFPAGVVKLGRSTASIRRCVSHAAAGANRFWFIPATKNIVKAEEEMLYIAALYGGRRRGISEYFTEMSFDQGIDAALEGIERADRPVFLSDNVVDLDQLTSYVVRTPGVVFPRGAYWIRYQEAAEFLQIDVPKLKRWVQRGYITAYRMPGTRTTRFRVDDLRALLTSSCPSSTNE